MTCFCCPFSRLRTLVCAAWSLVDKLDWLNGAPLGDLGFGSSAGGAPGPLNPMLRQIRVVRESRQRLEGLATRFLNRSQMHLQQLITGLVQEIMNDWGRHNDRKLGRVNLSRVGWMLSCPLLAWSATRLFQHVN
jgi:hypothetical protein